MQVCAKHVTADPNAESRLAARRSTGHIVGFFPLHLLFVFERFGAPRRPVYISLNRRTQWEKTALLFDVMRNFNKIAFVGRGPAAEDALRSYQAVPHNFPAQIGVPIRRSGMDTLLFSCKSILNLVKNAVDGCRMT